MVDLRKTLQAAEVEVRAGHSAELELLQDIVLVVVALQERVSLLEQRGSDPDFPRDSDEGTES